MLQPSRAVLYAVCLLGWLSVGVTPACLAFQREESQALERFLAPVPLVPAEEIKAEFKSIIEAPAGESPKLYFVAFDRIKELQVLVQKGDHAAVGIENKVPYRGLAGLGPTQLHQRYVEKFGNETLAEASKAWSAQHESRRLAEPVSPDHFGVLGWRLYITGLPFALMFLVVRLDAEGFSLLVETLSPWRLLLAIAFWPIGIFKYPSGAPEKQLVRALRFATFTLTTSLSGFAGTAVAQTTSTTKDKKKDDPHTLQLDLRVSDALGDGKPEGFLRATVITAQGWFFETVNTARPDRWNLSGVAGKRLAKTSTLNVYAVAGTARNSLGLTTAVAGGQAFLNTKRLGFLLPALYYERRSDDKEGFAMAGFAVAKTKQFRFGADFTFRKTEGLKPQWSIGPLLAKHTAKGFAEVAAIRNSFGEWRVRGRFVHSFAW